MGSIAHLFMITMDQRINYKYEELAKYNSRVAKGIVHTKEYDKRMKEMQEEFDREQEQSK